MVLRGVCRMENVNLEQTSNNNCIQRILINGKEQKSTYNEKYAEIDLKSTKLEHGDSVKVRIIYTEGCALNVLNYEQMLLEEVEVAEFNISPEGDVEFKAMGEVAPLEYFIQAYKWNKWATVDTVKGVGKYDVQKYTAKVPFHRGKNIFRISRPNYSFLSEVVSDTVHVNKDLVNAEKPKVRGTSIVFAKRTAFEVFDSFGNIVRQGAGMEVMCAGLIKGTYYLNYDEINKEFRIDRNGRPKLNF